MEHLARWFSGEQIYQFFWLVLLVSERININIADFQNILNIILSLANGKINSDPSPTMTVYVADDYVTMNVVYLEQTNEKWRKVF